MRVVVTGGMGFIGTSVVRRLLAMGHSVICVDFLEELVKLYEKHRMPIMQEVYRNLRDCANVMSPYEYLSIDPPAADAYIHLGACVDTREIAPDLFYKNVTYMRHFVDHLPYNANVVFGSSAAVYGTNGAPINPYGLTKSIGENIITGRSDINTTILRFFNVFGRYEHHKAEMSSLPFKLASAYQNRNRFQMWSPDASRDFVSVSDVTDAVVGHTLNPSRLGIWDVGRGESVGLGDLDYMLRVIFDRPESACEIVDMPEKYKGRYQVYTCAGSRAPISPYIKKRDIRDDLREQFCEEN